VFNLYYITTKDGIHVGWGWNSWLITFQGYTLKLSPSIDDIWKQSSKELEIVKIAFIEMQFEYLCHPLGYKNVQGNLPLYSKGNSPMVEKQKLKVRIGPTIIKNQVG